MSTYLWSLLHLIATVIHSIVSHVILMYSVCHFSIRGIKPDSSFSTHLDANAIGSQMKLIARLIKIRNERGRGINRDVFHAQMSGFDAHFKCKSAAFFFIHTRVELALNC